MLTKRLILKFSLIGIIVISASGTIFFILPEYFDLESEKMTYTGFPTYSCTEPYKVQTCLNKTALHGYSFSNDGRQVVDIDFKLSYNDP